MYKRRVKSAAKLQHFFELYNFYKIKVMKSYFLPNRDCKRGDCFANTTQKANARMMCGQSTRICPQNHSPVITRHQTRMNPAYGSAQYFRQYHPIAGKILKGIINQFQSVQGSGEKTTVYETIAPINVIIPSIQ